MANIRERVDTSWEQLQQTLNGIPDDRAGEPGVCGEWSVKDLLGHIAFYDDRIITVVDAEANGRELEPFDWQAANDEVAAQRAGWTLAQARQEFDAAHGRLLDAVARYPDLAPDTWAECTWDHYAEHGAQIQAWREQQGI